MYVLMLIAMFGAVAAQAVVVDRIAIITGERAIKTSDIEREVRVTELLNGDPLDLGPQARKKAAERLIDQAVIRKEIEVGGYSSASEEDAKAMLAQLKKERFRTPAEYTAALAKYGISEDQLLRHLRWQLTVLRFIEERFRPGVMVTDQDIESHYKQHYPNGSPPLASARSKIESEIAGERINQAFYSWLEQQRKQAKPEFIEGALE